MRVLAGVVSKSALWVSGERGEGYRGMNECPLKE